MNKDERRLELLKMEGEGFSKCEIVNDLSVKYQVSTRQIYNDFENRKKWQPRIQMIDSLLAVKNRYLQIYREASFLFLHSTNENSKLGALNTMLVANHHLAEIIPFDESEQKDISLSWKDPEPGSTEDLLKQFESAIEDAHNQQFPTLNDMDLSLLTLEERETVDEAMKLILKARSKESLH